MKNAALALSFWFLNFESFLVLQAIAMYLLLGRLSTGLWWTMVGIFVFCYFAGKTYNVGLTNEEDTSVQRFWYQVRSLMFIISVVSVIGLYSYLLIG